MADHWKKEMKHIRNVDFSSVKSEEYRGKPYNCVIVNCSVVVKEKYKKKIFKNCLELVGQEDFTLIWVQ